VKKAMLAIFVGALFALLAAAAIMSPRPPASEVTRKGGWFSSDYDSTDDAANRRRSGLAIYVDHATGLQYLGTPGGGLTPRLGLDGSHMRIDHD
jgi:hypothetical protein